MLPGGRLRACLRDGKPRAVDHHPRRIDSLDHRGEPVPSHASFHSRRTWSRRTVGSVVPSHVPGRCLRHSPGAVPRASRPASAPHPHEETGTELTGTTELHAGSSATSHADEGESIRGAKRVKTSRARLARAHDAGARGSARHRGVHVRSGRRLRWTCATRRRRPRASLRDVQHRHERAARAGKVSAARWDAGSRPDSA